MTATTVVVYVCRFCNETREASASDIENARQWAREDYGEDVTPLDDQQAHDAFGRDICPTCTGEG